MKYNTLRFQKAQILSKKFAFNIHQDKLQAINIIEEGRMKEWWTEGKI